MRLLQSVGRPIFFIFRGKVRCILDVSFLPDNKVIENAVKNQAGGLSLFTGYGVGDLLLHVLAVLERRVADVLLNV